MLKHRLKIILIFLIFTLVFISECQRGRGGGSSGGRSSSSFSSRSSSYRSYGGTGGTSSPGQTIAIVVGSVCIAFCCFGCAVSDWKSLFSSLRQKTNNSQIIQAQFQRLKAVKNKVSTIIMKPKYYQQYIQIGQPTRIFNTKIKQQPEDQFIDKIFLQGCDEIGSWKGKGYFLASVDGPYVWWMKDYDDKENAGQVGDSQFLVYQSTSYYQGRWQGRWYYEGDQNDKIYSGSWSLYDPSNQFAIDSISEASPRKWNPFDVLGGRLNPSPI